LGLVGEAQRWITLTNSVTPTHKQGSDAVGRYVHAFAQRVKSINVQEQMTNSKSSGRSFTHFKGNLCLKESAQKRLAKDTQFLREPSASSFSIKTALVSVSTLHAAVCSHTSTF